MRTYETDQEQRVVFQKWWQRQGKWLALAVLVGLLLGSAWQYLQRYRLEQRAAASQIYQAMLATVATNEKGGSSKSLSLLSVYAAQLKNHYRSTPYASFAAFFLAKKAISEKNLPAAQAEFSWVIANSLVPMLKEVARMRAARLLIAEKKPDAAIRLLATVDDTHYAPMIEQLRGDAHYAKGDQAGAGRAYKKAQRGYAAMGSQNALVDMAIASE